MAISALRVTSANDRGVHKDGEYVLYWMIAQRRPTFNAALERAVGWSVQLGKPLLVLEALRVGYRWASDRLHAFILQGMRDNQAHLSEKPCTYFPYVEREAGAGSGLVEALASKAALVVTDDFPCFFLPRMVQALAGRAGVLVEKVDSNGLLPMRAADQVFARAYDFRRFLQKTLSPFLSQTPLPDPFAGKKLPPPIDVDREILLRWPAATQEMLATNAGLLSSLPIDHTVAVATVPGGHRAARRRMTEFLHDRLAKYADDRNEPEKDGTSGLSPYLHFGHLSVHEVMDELARVEEWSPEHLGRKTSGQREGWWNMSPAAEAFLDELITWRELGYNMGHQREDFDRYESLPEWARQTLAEHARDPREHLYSLVEFENADTHDPLWNAAQNQIRREGRMHNYLRMLWGKKILEWSRSPEQALETMIELNNKYGLDGRNPNSYSGIFWVLGRYDRAWGPERPVFGKIRYMSSANTARKFSVDRFITRYAP